LDKTKYRIGKIQLTVKQLTKKNWFLGFMYVMMLNIFKAVTEQ